jgi:hypothetical protein
VIAYKARASVQLVNRNRQDLTRRFAELATAVAALPARTLILDGEIAVFDTKQAPRFAWLRERPKDRGNGLNSRRPPDGHWPGVQYALAVLVSSHDSPEQLTRRENELRV